MSKPLRQILFALLCVVVLSISALPAFAQRTHIVRYGETLSGIAVNYGTTVAAIASANNIVNPSRIYPGQVLVIPAATIPGGGMGGITYTVRTGDSLTSIAQRYNVTLSALISANPITIGTTLMPGMVLSIPYSAPVYQPTPVPVPPSYPPSYYGQWHYVQPGQTLFQIARLYGRDIYAIARANGLLNLNRIYWGTWLRIP